MTNQSKERLLNQAWTAGRVVFWVAAVVYSIELSRRSIQLGDEGCLMSQVTAMLDGKVPYRDIDMFVTPGIWYVLKWLFSVTGPGLLVTRWAAAACLLATMLLSRRIVSEVGGPRWGDLAPLLIAIFSMWAFPAWSFAFYSPWATMFALAALAALLGWRRTRGNAWLLACGMACGLSLVFKQNYGVYAAAGCGLAVATELAFHRAHAASWPRVLAAVLRAGALLLAGVVVPILPLLLLLVRADAADAAFHSLILRPFYGFSDSHTIPYLAFGDLFSFAQLHLAGGYIYRAVPMSTTEIALRWPSWALWVVDLLHWGLYWIPPALFAGVLIRTWRRAGELSASDRALTCVAIFAAVYFLGVFPRADLNHLINVYQPVLCLAAAAAAVLLGQPFRTWRPASTAMAAAGCTLLAGYSLIAAAWMNDVRKLYAHPVTAARAGVLATEYDAQSINSEVALLRDSTAEGEPVYAIASLSMLPFLAERPMPSRFCNYYSVHVGFDSGASAAKEIETSGARIILADYQNFFADPKGILTYAPLLTDYLSRSFAPTKAVGDQRHLLLERHPVPREFVPSVLLDSTSCRSLGGGPPRAYLNEHLLFHSLTHTFAGASGSVEPAITVCRVHLPSKARLRVQLQLRQLDPARPGGFAEADAWVWPDTGSPTQLFSTDWRLATETTSTGPVSRAFDVSLEPWAWSSISLVLRSRLDGTIPAFTLDDSRMSILWNEPRVESPGYLVGPVLPDLAQSGSTIP